jgi:DNA-binding XRE family transcriptional regulator
VAKGRAGAGRVGDFAGRARRPAPTEALPGSPEKIAELAARARRRESLFSPDDVTEDELRGLLGRATRLRDGAEGYTNGHPMVTGSAQEKEKPRKGKCVPQRLEMLGGRIHHFRTQRGLSQGQLARKAGIHPMHLSALERGVRFPCLGAVIAIAEALDMTPDQLTGYKPPPARYAAM